MADLTTSIFDLQRKRALEQDNSTAQQEGDAIQRRFAAQGGLNSGAYIKAQEVQGDSAMKRRQAALDTVDMAQAQDAANKDQIAKQQAFQTSEREAGQGFSAQQADLGRQFTTSERTGSQDFTAGQNLAQRKFTTGEREAGQGFTARQNQDQMDFQEIQAGRAQKFQADIENKKNALAQRGIDLEADAQEFNKLIAAHEAGLPYNGGKLGLGSPSSYGSASGSNGNIPPAPHAGMIWSSMNNTWVDNHY